MDIFYIFTTALGAILGGFFGAYYNYKFLNRKYSKIRSIAIKALNIFEGYAKYSQTYFSSNTRLLAVRAVAKKYVNDYFSKSKCDMEKMVVNYPLPLSDIFTPGEQNILNVFRARSCWTDYFDKNGNSIPQKMEELKKEIDLGLWDTYLFWDWESYQNMQNQNNLAIAVRNMMNTNVNMQQTSNRNIGN